MRRAPLIMLAVAMVLSGWTACMSHSATAPQALRQPTRADLLKRQEAMMRCLRRCAAEHEDLQQLNDCDEKCRQLFIGGGNG